jgi:dolichyl-phosphate beta-glucosyltransferase
MYNESAIIEQTARALSDYLSEKYEDYEILFSNDGSTDGCEKIADSLGLPNVRVVGYSQNRGKGCAVRTAMLDAKGDVILFTDADLAYGLDVIESLMKTVEENPNAQVFIGSRNLHEDGYENYTFFRKIASKLYIKVICAVGGIKLTDSQCGFKAFRHDAAKEIFSECEVDGFAFDFEALLWAKEKGFRVCEIPVKVINHRESKVRLFADAIKMLGDLMKMKKRIRRASKQKREDGMSK